MANTLAAAQILERIYWRAWLVMAIFPDVVLIVVAVEPLRPPRPRLHARTQLARRFRQIRRQGACGGRWRVLALFRYFTPAENSPSANPGPPAREFGAYPGLEVGSFR
jgi:hypothetical protein